MDMLSLLGKGSAFTLPPIPCGVCVAHASNAQAITLGEPPTPQNSVTVVLGTPACAQHASQLVEAFMTLTDLAAMERNGRVYVSNDGQATTSEDGL